MEEFQPLHRLDSDPSGGFALYEARSPHRDRNVTLKSWECAGIADADAVLKSAVRKLLAAAYSAELISLYIDSSEDRFGTFRVNFVWNTPAEAIDMEIIRKCESSLPVGKCGYRNKALKCVHDSTKVKEAWSEHLQQTVQVSKFLFDQLSDVNATLRDVLIQAKVAQECTGRLLDVCLTVAKSGRPRLHVVMENLQTNLQAEVSHRAATDLPYTEEELLLILRDAMEGLLLAKGKNIAHRDIRPANLFKTAENRLKIAFFSSQFGKSFNLLSQDRDEIQLFLSPEARGKSENDFKPFPSDIFSLGLTLFYCAKLGKVSSVDAHDPFQVAVKSEVMALGVAEDTKRLLLSMLAFDPSLRPTLETVKSTVDQLLENFQKLKSRAIEIATIGRGNMKIGDLEGAAHYLPVADELLSEHFPSEIAYPVNLSNWADLMRAKGSVEEAREKYALADCVFAKYHPSSLHRAINLGSWGLMLMDTEHEQEAGAKFEAADCIYRLFPTDLNNAKNKMNWADLCRRCGQNEDAAEKHALAEEIFSKCYSADLSRAANLTNWGLSLKNLSQHQKALKKYSQADALYTQYFPSSIHSATNLYNWACLYELVGEKEKALQKIQAAHNIYVRVGSPMAASHSGVVLQRLKWSAKSPPVSPRTRK